jgi:hypothetical protein
MKKKLNTPNKPENTAAAITVKPKQTAEQTGSRFDPEEVEKLAMIGRSKSRRDPDKRNTGAWVHSCLKEALPPAARKLSTTEAALVEASLVMTLLRVGTVGKKTVDDWIMDGDLSESASLTLQRLSRLYPIKDVKQMPVF